MSGNLPAHFENVGEPVELRQVYDEHGNPVFAVDLYTLGGTFIRRYNGEDSWPIIELLREADRGCDAFHAGLV